MSDDGNKGGLDWRDGVPISGRFDDPYYSLQDGLAETRHTFIDGNAMRTRFGDGFHVAELGFGTGLTAVTVLHALRESRAEGRLRFTSFEAFPLTQPQMAEALSAFPEIADTAADFLAAWDGQGAQLSDFDLHVIVGDARTTLPAWEGRADAWCLDGFAPARNPGLWETDLLAQVARHTAPGGTCATYTAAGQVRRDLAAAGFTVERVPGFGRKRHMTRGRLD
ncbi:tRNA (5-methylaminomethyl-2-thiouridine)(34)-methyltransferase MnmD [Palleronia abyssalis]|uniref:tRNA 5-methylaminomethyl-2-thiouridine biosynthesis bifunctional protein MnmC n=1 Tax=Palleronia abyssalis TaxID=1501240 RepID=A0A2R8BTX8_9RHOB|nr:tRNA (5-methylaminomethyl-2-thiouridine)(34)-methyltransferase MnmD [Palleronia abyssalis]SPJ23585.1 tRNA 5-methylaminomethyl-2-thiouridine biosynthesis bifunctional protein MnmC [Palleronia abyssalis]